MSEPQELALLNRAQVALSSATTIDEIRDLRDKAEVLRAYARKAKLGPNILVEASIVEAQAERRLGEMLRETRLARGSLGNQHTRPDETTGEQSHVSDVVESTAQQVNVRIE
jgi:hypothetical protein